VADETAFFKCLRCGHQYQAVNQPDMERTCPNCRSNSVRRLRGRPKPSAEETKPALSPQPREEASP
jgi:predicted  nucleic acid-binding Zn-ribbon protein